MEKIVMLRVAPGARPTSGGFVSRYEFFAAHDYSKQLEAVRSFEVKGRNKAERAAKFIQDALDDNLTVETFNSYGERIQIVGLQ